jgi:hypothetical protein
MTFVEYAVGVIIEDSKKDRQEAKMCNAVKNESEEQLIVRVLSIMAKLQVGYVQSEREFVFGDEDYYARQIIALLKERLVSEIARLAPA